MIKIAQWQDSWTHPWLQINPMGYIIIMNPPMVTNEPHGLRNYHEPTHGYKWTQWVTKLSWTHPWLQMNPMGYKIIDELIHGYK
jgi:hypothetical protein